MNRSDTKPLVHVSARVPEEVAAKLDAAAARLRTDRSHVIRCALEDMPAEYEPKPAKKGRK